jgi:hypothetical protein
MRTTALLTGSTDALARGGQMGPKLTFPAVASAWLTEAACPAVSRCSTGRASVGVWLRRVTFRRRTGAGFGAAASRSAGTGRLPAIGGVSLIPLPAERARGPTVPASVASTCGELDNDAVRDCRDGSRLGTVAAPGTGDGDAVRGGGEGSEVTGAARRRGCTGAGNPMNGRSSRLGDFRTADILQLPSFPAPHTLLNEELPYVLTV